MNTLRQDRNRSAYNAPPELELGALALVLDQAGVVIAAEPICAALFQWEPAELVGQIIEVLLVAGADTIRQQLVPDPGPSDPDSEAQPRLFALAQRKDGTSFPVAVTLQLYPPNTRCWWAVAFHDVNTPPVAQSEIRAVGSLPPGLTPRRGRAQVAAPLDLEDIPDVFERAPAEPASLPRPPAAAAAVAPEPPVLAPLLPPGQEQPAPGAPHGQPAPASPDAHLHELQQRLSQSAADLKRTRAHLQQQDEQLHAASSAAQQAATALEEETARRTQLEAQLAQAGDEFNQQLCAEQQTRAESEARLHELEQRLAQSAEDLKCAQAQSPQPPALSPAPSAAQQALQDQLLELEGRLRTAVTSLARTTAELETERGERRRSEHRAASLAARMQQLHEELKNQLASEQIDHQRLAQLEHQLHEQTQEYDLAIARLQSALQLEQCERKRLEAELLRSRFLSTDSARAGRALVNGLRRQLRPPVESLHHAACRLLQLQLSDDQKQLAQTLLESALLLQTSLQESPES